MERRRAYKRQKYNSIYNRRRDPKYLAFYRSKEWRLLSRTYLQRAGYKCQAKLEGCTGLAVEVHHKDPIQTAKGWGARLDWENLEAVCTSCHNKRHPEKFKKSAEPGVIDLRKI
jgi:5-methylcytosine-specific restriction protein A